MRCHRVTPHAEDDIMFRYDPNHIEFINRFVDAVIVRPMLDDLRRASETRAMFRSHQPSKPQEARETEAA
ncbi:hypothetical protein G6O69_08250 [Pseudenhygromyxa sp. WMMC2535]|uniref:hypothetical protein n=1 Tax=Pseudenhygromyxa sp. WMMC2535 TaxID=2712867 RepID=UPI001554E432|nr:hypothetical protein [Pseudenhygromyxa sp. WMMC2535]NVB37822.1 hypothetical protein [Pseudenhygromyxa sp. WMMC2535]